MATVEVVYMRHYSANVSEHDSIDDALSFIKYSEDDGQMSTVGIMVDGEPHIWDGYLTKDAPTDEQAAEMRRYYDEARR
jgi:hypothetical protein